MKQCSRLDMLGDGKQYESGSTLSSDCQRSTRRRISECLMDAWGLTAGDLFANIADLGILDKPFSASVCDEDDLDLLFNKSDNCSIELTLQPPVCKGDVWDSADSLWNTGTIDIETENQILQLLAHNVGDVTESSPSCCDVTATDSLDNINVCQSQLLYTSSSSGVGSCASSSCGYSADDSGLEDDNLNFHSFPDFDEEFSDDLWNDMQLVVLPDDNSETDDESEEVDIMSVMEEVESVTDASNTCTAVLSVEQLKTLYTVRVVSNDHCYCPQVTNLWLDSAENPSRIRTTAKSKSRSARDNSKQQCGSKKSCVPLKRASIRRTEAIAASRAIGHRAARHLLYNNREKREQLNQMERERRVGLKTCFERLRLAVPEIASNPKASKDKILLLARSCVDSVERKHAELMKEKMTVQREHDLLSRRLKASNIRN